MKLTVLKKADARHRVAKHEGRDHIVVPVVALVEGVIHPVNAPNPELVRADRLIASVSKWEGQPLYAGHPMRDGEPVDGHREDILPESFGFTRNARVADGKRLEMEAWIDPSRIAEGTPAADVLERVLSDAPDVIEVSVGVYAAVDDGAEGEWEGKRFAGEWIRMEPNHLALLGRRETGACSVDMGCGALRAAAGPMRLCWPDKDGNDDHGRGHADAAEAHDKAADAHDKAADGLFEPNAARKLSQAAVKESGYAGGNDAAGAEALGHADKARGSEGDVAKGHHVLAARSHRKQADAHRKAAMPKAATSGFRAAWPDKDGNDDHGRGPGSVAAEPRFKAGDRIRVKSHELGSYVGKTGTIERTGVSFEGKPTHYVRLHGNGGTAYVHDSDMEKADTGGTMMKGLLGRALAMFRAAMPADWNDNDVRDELREALAEAEGQAVDIVAVYDDRVVYVTYPPPSPYPGPGYVTPAKPTYWSRSTAFDKAAQEYELGDRVEVEPTMTYEPCEPGDMKTASGTDELRAACGCGGHEPSACKCMAGGTSNDQPAPAAQGEPDMKREQRIAALAANQHSPVKSAKALEAMTDEELAALEATAETALKAASAKPEPEPAAPVEITEEQFLERAPQSLRDLVAAKRQQDAEETARLVGSLKAAQSAFTEDELKAMPLAQLRKLGAAIVKDTVDYGLQGMPRVASAGDEYDYKAPDPYAGATKQ